MKVLVCEYTDFVKINKKLSPGKGSEEPKSVWSSQTHSTGTYTVSVLRPARPQATVGSNTFANRLQYFSLIEKTLQS